MYAPIVSDCTRMCQNGAAKDEENCTCDCIGGFTGPNCEGECIAYNEFTSSKYFALLHVVVTVPHLCIGISIAQVART